MTPWVNRESADKPETVRDHVPLWRTVSAHLGEPAMLRIREAYRDNWITDADFARIHDAGFNHVRVPFLVDLLDEPSGMKWLHRAVDMAKQHGLYVVLDLHGVPGRQSSEHHTGEEHKNGLWSSPEFISQFEAAWTKVGREFADEPAVAMYDVMNEPMGAPNTATMFLIYDRVIRAIRKVAPTKVLAIEEGYKGFENVPRPALFGWSNIAYSLHFYQFDAKKASDHTDAIGRELAKQTPIQRDRSTPLYAGEFNLEPFNSPEAMRGVVSQFDHADGRGLCGPTKLCR